MKTIFKKVIFIGILGLSINHYISAADEIENDESVEEIIVTATYRETNLMDTPVSMSVVSDALAEDMGAQSMEGIHTAIPGLTMTGSVNGTNRYSIRGISSQSGENVYQLTGATVGVYIDDVPITSAMGPNRQSNGVLFDIDRVEVLKALGNIIRRRFSRWNYRFIYNQPDASDFDYAFNASLLRWMSLMITLIERHDGQYAIESTALRVIGWILKQQDSLRILILLKKI